MLSPDFPWSFLSHPVQRRYGCPDSPRMNSRSLLRIGQSASSLQCQTMFTKQVSRPVDSLDPPSWPRRRSRSSGLENLVTGPIRRLCALQVEDGADRGEALSQIAPPFLPSRRDRVCNPTGSTPTLIVRRCARPRTPPVGRYRSPARPSAPPSGTF